MNMSTTITPDEAIKLLGLATKPRVTKEIELSVAPDVTDKFLEAIDMAIEALGKPEIIYCKDCVKHNKGLGNYEVHPDGSSTWIWKDRACPLVSWRDKAQGHEFDYQFCAYAEKREVTE